MEEDAEERPVLPRVFGGTGSIGRRAYGYDIISVDAGSKARANVTRDILDFNVSELGVDTVWASRSCAHYSRSRGGTIAEELADSNELVWKTLRIARACNVFVGVGPYGGVLAIRKPTFKAADLVHV